MQRLIWVYFKIEEMRQRGRFAGFSLFVSDTDSIQGSSLCYRDGPQLLPLNFTATCTEHRRYVIFYNERLDGVSYPERYQLRNVFFWTFVRSSYSVTYVHANATKTIVNATLHLSILFLYERLIILHFRISMAYVFKNSAGHGLFIWYI